MNEAVNNQRRMLKEACIKLGFKTNKAYKKFAKKWRRAQKEEV